MNFNTIKTATVSIMTTCSMLLAPEAHAQQRLSYDDCIYNLEIIRHASDNITYDWNVFAQYYPECAEAVQTLVGQGEERRERMRESLPTQTEIDKLECEARHARVWNDYTQTCDSSY